MQSAEDGDDWLSALKEKEFALGLDLYVFLTHAWLPHFH
jgi:hypothetical protein